ncbi:uncharacterized protein F4807DRAFT_459252 [Annulohypoxylon truncatum]|uniref:uncharacterized protein n=1 Tax=Annulohypoxylon truncatum TaxID=327061 RepID=UPI002008D0DE|nr:uncharacterized protein F4807DRAFT_459252 [Annulohypoxylon truncatum]KAI1211022.1 hypothetical protein F4807DRAFT_459252 [Annulohypoxylon truncatum]
MFQLPVSGPNAFLRDEEIIAAGSKDANVFPYSFDGNGTTMTDATKAESAEKCGWRGDSPEPQLDDITHDEQLHLCIPDDTCSWHGDPVEPELDDLAHHSKDERYPKLSPKSQAPSHTGQQSLAVKPEPLATPPKAPDEEKKADAPPDNKPPPNKDKEEKVPDDSNDETLQEKVAHGVQQAFNMFRGMVESSEKPREPDHSKGGNPPAKEEGIAPEPRPVPPIPSKPQPAKVKKSKEEKEMAKQEKVEARKADKERKVKEKEEKKRLKKEMEAAKKEQRRKSKDKKKNKGKETASSPPDLPAGAEGTASAEADPQLGCHICQHPEEEGTIDFLRDSLENWQGLPSLDELTDAAKRLLSMTDGNGFPSEREASQSTAYWDEQELIDHIAAHIDRHIHQHFDLNSPEGGNPEVGKAPPLKPNPSSQNEEPAPPEKQLENDSPANHGLDGNRDWPLSIMQNHILRSLEPISTPDIVATRPSQAYSPHRGPVSRCVSPWCEQLGFTVGDSPPSFAKRNGSWLRRG